jgi:hypothetical protein
MYFCRAVFTMLSIFTVAWIPAGGCDDSDDRKPFIPPAFSLVATVPADGATDAGLWPVMLMTFNYQADPATITAANIMVEESGGGPVSGAFHIVGDAVRALFIPDAALNSSTDYTITFTGSVLNAFGMPLDLTTFSNPVTFTTGNGSDSTPPVFAGASGAMLLKDGIEVTWSAATDDTAAQDEIVYFIYRAQTSGAHSFAAPYAVAGSGDTSFLDGGEAAVHYYVVRARDTFGNIDSNTVEVIGGGVPPIVSYAAELVPILIVSCAIGGCHTGITPAGDLDLSVYSSPEEGINGIVEEVIIGNPEVSNLIWRLEGTIAPQMPLVGDALTASQIQKFRNWITQGAPDN